MAQHIPTSANYHDLQGLASLRGKAVTNTDAALYEVAEQFEALFLQIILKESRDSGFGDPLFDSNDADMYRDMLDKQLSVSLSKKGDIGLAKTIVDQIRQQLPEQAVATNNPFSFSPSTRLYSVPTGNPAASIPALPGIKDHAPTHALPRAHVLSNLPVSSALPIASKQATFTSPHEFVSAVLPYAQRIAEKIDVPAETIVAQAALETGWGKHMIKNSDGSNSFNLFGIKADARWSGDRVKVTTTEFKNGVSFRKLDEFRSYASLEESVEDYAKFLRSSPRYEKALAETHSEGFLSELQKAGYATDPAYAEKITNIVSGGTLSDAMAALNI
jgi:flagellar protein FlgJ